MANAHVRSASGTFGGNTSGVATFSGTTSAGGLIIVGIVFTDGAASVSSVVDSASNTYTAVGAGLLSGAFSFSRIYYAKNVTGGTNIAVTVTINAGAFGGVIAHEVSGADTTAPLDQEAQNAQSAVGTGADAVTSGSDTTLANGEYIFGMTADESFGGPTQTTGTGFTAGQNSINDNGFVFSGEYQIQASAGSIAATFTHSAANDTATVMATFKAAGGAAETVTMDKWFHRTEPLRRAKTVPVASGIIGIRNT